MKCDCKFRQPPLSCAQGNGGESMENGMNEQKQTCSSNSAQGTTLELDKKNNGVHGHPVFAQMAVLGRLWWRFVTALVPC